MGAGDQLQFSSPPGRPPRTVTVGNLLGKGGQGAVHKAEFTVPPSAENTPFVVRFNPDPDSFDTNVVASTEIDPQYGTGNRRGD